MTPEQTRPPRLCRCIRRTRWSAVAASVHCDKVVYPGACLARACPFVYSFEAWGSTYVGCMQKVYDVEIDLDMLRAAERRKAGFGAIRAMREPLPMCHAEIERTYESRVDELGCVNPEFNELPRRPADVPGVRSAQGRLSSAFSRRRRIVRTASQPTRPSSTSSGSTEREPVDRADPDPAERDAEAVQRSVAVVLAATRESGWRGAGETVA